MFFNQEENNEVISIDNFITKSFNYNEFKNLFNEFKSLNLKGYGLVSQEKNGIYEIFYLIKANDFIFSIVATSEIKADLTTVTNLRNYCLIDPNILNNTSLFNGNEQIKSNFFKDFEVSIPVDVKFYEYSEDTKIIISKSGASNIDLYISFLFHHHKNPSFKIKINPNIINIIKHLKLAQILEERLKKITN